MSVRETVLKALDDAFSEQIKGLAGAVWAKAAGGESVDQAFKEFDSAFLLNVVKLHPRMIAEANAQMDLAGIAKEGKDA